MNWEAYILIVIMLEDKMKAAKNLQLKFKIVFTVIALVWRISKKPKPYLSQ